jgi:hypothetical protein
MKKQLSYLKRRISEFGYYLWFYVRWWGKWILPRRTLRQKSSKSIHVM